MLNMPKKKRKGESGALYYFTYKKGWGPPGSKNRMSKYYRSPGRMAKAIHLWAGSDWPRRVENLMDYTREICPSHMLDTPGSQADPVSENEELAIPQGLAADWHQAETVSVNEELARSQSLAAEEAQAETVVKHMREIYHNWLLRQSLKDLPYLVDDHYLVEKIQEALKDFRGEEEDMAALKHRLLQPMLGTEQSCEGRLVWGGDRAVYHIGKLLGIDIKSVSLSQIENDIGALRVGKYVVIGRSHCVPAWTKCLGDLLPSRGSLPRDSYIAFEDTFVNAATLNGLNCDITVRAAGDCCFHAIGVLTQLDTPSTF